MSRGMLNEGTVSTNAGEKNPQSASSLGGILPDVVAGSSLFSSDSQGHSVASMSVLQTAKGRCLIDPRKASGQGLVGARSAMKSAAAAGHGSDTGAKSSDADDNNTMLKSAAVAAVTHPR